MSFGATMGGRLGGFVYGAVLVLALLAALETPPPPEPFETVALLLGSALAVVLAHAHAGAIQADFDAARGVDWRKGLREVGVHWPIAVPAAPPCLLFTVAGLGGMTNANAFDASYVLLLAALFAVGYASQRRIGRSRARASFVGLADLALGMLIVMLKILVH